VAAAALAVAVAVAVLPPAAPAVAEPAAVRIMPIGDSITEGADGDVTWRYRLWHQLRDAGHDVEFVGTRSGVAEREDPETGEKSPGFPRYADYDQDHQAWSGWMADEVVWQLEEWREAGNSAVSAQDPDIALVHLGTNDLSRDLEHFGQTPADAVVRTIGDLRRLVIELRAQRPGITIVLAQIIPNRKQWWDETWELRQATTELNAAIPGLAAELSNDASPVVVVDHHGGFDIDAHLRDELHPNDAGEQRMADRWAAALQPLLAGGPPPTTTTTVPPTTTTTVPPTTTTTVPPPTTTTTVPPTTTTTTAPPAATSGYWVVADDGRVWSFGGAADLGGVPLRPGDVAVDIEATPDGRGFWVVTAGGQVVARGGADHHGDALLDPGETAASISSSRSGGGYLVVTSRGRALEFGDAPHHGDMAGSPLNAPVVDSVTTPTGDGYWMVAADGGVFTFGAATFDGSMGGRPLNSPVDSIVPDPDRAGYWLGAADGGVFAFEADFRGSMGGVPLNRPVTGMARSGTGYLLVGADGGVFSFSGLPFAGSLGDAPPARPVVSITALR
jgi:hypothetical protein